MPPAARPRTLNVLFIGNSFTARNGMPAMIADLAAADGHTLHHRLISVGGASLGRHWNAGQARAVIASGGLDFVVLQEQSTLPARNAKLMHESVRLFDAVIRAAGARTVLYMTWARRHEPEQQAKIAEAYTSIATELGALLAPVGLAWERALRAGEVGGERVGADAGKRAGAAGGKLAAAAGGKLAGAGAAPSLYDKDGSHPSAAGSRLAAEVLYGVLFGAER